MSNTESMRTACKEYEEDLVLYYYGECSAEEHDRIQAHVKNCASCFGFLSDLHRLLPLTVKMDEPPQAFWASYSQEVRQKLAGVKEGSPWWEGLFSFLRPWPIPVLATALVVIIAVTLILPKETWRAREAPPKEEALLEVMPIAENLEFYKSMDFLDSLDLLEGMGGPGDSGSA